MPAPPGPARRRWKTGLKDAAKLSRNSSCRASPRTRAFRRMMRVSAPSLSSNAASSRSCSARGATTTKLRQPFFFKSSSTAAAPSSGERSLRPPKAGFRVVPLRGRAKTWLSPQSFHARFAAETKLPVRKATQRSGGSSKAVNRKAANSRSPWATRSGAGPPSTSTRSSLIPSKPNRKPGGSSASTRGKSFTSMASRLFFRSSTTSSAHEGSRT
mmetsp:Transcript_108261/g.316669  ORF Transcript_108261/g.316669 Transcript_108261/m.316669 type:complete len:214 (-) Transcript_108261:82-723(-)